MIRSREAVLLLAEVAVDHDVGDASRDGLRTEQEVDAQSLLAVEGTADLTTLFPETPAARYLQYHYLARNPYPVENKLQLDDMYAKKLEGKLSYEMV